MKIQALNEVNTINPEYHWKKGEVKEVSIKVGQKLLTNPNFREVVKTSYKKDKKRI